MKVFARFFQKAPLSSLTAAAATGPAAAIGLIGAKPV
jgi:hypothetical protein